ncbi:disease resistance RPP13-like protein 4 [Andrographis paniculata]|uniref:disease resistance RPP13-like protein 4 n=1 Tax=Andrographis paniculata TaxID=175694 RepID=UPI0021E83F52|nr:disease resistance RPP13-like protein 4 [Andrographis paniculata]XP_051115637.1 disease resistance RPP13-like protein 4 [Andrographis paniculata]XP_051115638.1 disease resistance RPP13-like protein 4 [Andrographis paniculata]
MAIAAYASVVSLTHIIDNVHYRAQHSLIHVDKRHIESLQDNANCLLKFVEINSRRKDQKIEALWPQISKLCFEAEDIFDLHVTSQLEIASQGENGDMGQKAFCEDLDSIIEKIDIIKRELSMVEEVGDDQVQVEKQRRSSDGIGGSSTEASSNGKNTIVGLDEDVVKIKGELARDEANLQIVPIVGMGGIGKTTLARKVYEDKYVLERFDVRIWLTISQEYSMEEILRGLIDNGIVEMNGGNIDGPGEALYKKLYGRRYLIVMDDIWSLEAWYDLRRFFPNNGNGSRIMMTTRIVNVAGSLGSHNPHSMAFLNGRKSWILFCQTIFGEDDCQNPELAKIGRRIVKSCQGLPLEIIVVGGLLAKSGTRKDFWQSVAENVSSFGNASDGEHCLKILLLSYNNLPLYLKPCFLYMRIFQEDAVINVSGLIRLWV